MENKLPTRETYKGEKMKKTIIILILFFSTTFLSACTNRIEHTPLQWCLLDVLHNEPYDDGDAIEAYKVEPVSLVAEDDEYYREFVYVITVIFTNEDGNLQFDYWYCFASVKQRCTHNAFDYIRDKSSENALICQYCIELDCDWFKTEIF